MNLVECYNKERYSWDEVYAASDIFIADAKYAFARAGNHVVEFNVKKGYLEVESTYQRLD